MYFLREFTTVYSNSKENRPAHPAFALENEAGRLTRTPPRCYVTLMSPKTNSDAPCGREDRLREWYLYLVRCRGGSLYTGIATDVERRLAEHRAGKGAKHLRGRGPLKLVYKQRIGSRAAALKIESRVKKWPKEKKERLAAAGTGIEDTTQRDRS
jgi:putative endonuclease